ncbi:thyrotropin-releasing hormone receptor-like [Acanthaster planci]|uniref:Thyrotropin-releasing hormone receptor-like n=1 Tax=Acanthaster planci TaxID=133434 RepID=A0A8B7XKC1_ACAPL|nr:thyrotropin-releasing hormone receptor-like [Acanthaster planci]XP_022081253.1 thyrotropin-releasing hormone receptor-like [Acanthaster planci]
MEPGPYKLNYSQPNDTQPDSQCANFTEEDVARSVMYNSGTFVIVGVMPFLTLFGVTANLAFLYVVYRRRTMRTITNAYLANLAVADIGFLVSAVVPALVQYTSSPIVFDQLPIGPVGCVLVNCVILIFFYGSVFMVFLVSYERYCAICRPLHQRVVVGKKRTTKLIVGAWFVAIVFSSLVIPSLVTMKTRCVIRPEGKEFEKFPKEYGLCQPPETAQWLKYVSNGFKMVPFFTAMFSSGYIYTKIVIQLNKKIPGLANRRRYNQAMSNVLRSRRQIAVMLIATGVIFFVCQAPAQVNTLAAMITDHPNVEPILNRGQRGIVQWVSRALLFINSAVNPIVYNVTNSKYRRAFVETYICKQKKKVTLRNTRSIQSMYIPNGSNKVYLWSNNFELDKF